MIKTFLDLRGWCLKIKSHACHAWLHCYFILLLLFLHLIANVHLFRSSPNCMLLFSKENSRIWQESAILDEVKNKELICFFFQVFAELLLLFCYLIKFILLQSRLLPFIRKIDDTKKGIARIKTNVLVTWWLKSFNFERLIVGPVC